MKKSKRIISLFLCAMMILSVCSTGIFAFALEDVDNEPTVSAFEEKVNGYSGKLSTKAPTDQDVKDYESILSAYQELTMNQKEQIELFTQDKFYHLILEREAWKATTASRPAKAQYASAAEKANSIVTPLASTLEKAQELYYKLFDKSSTLSMEEKIDALASTSFEICIYAGLYNATYTSFKEALDSVNCGATLIKLLITFAPQLMAAADDVFPAAPAKVTAPKPASYEGGANSEEYKQAYNKYLAYLKEKAEYDAASADHTFSYQMKAWDLIAEKVPEYSGILPVLLEAKDAIDAYNADSSQTAAAELVAEKIDAMTTYQQKFMALTVSLYFRNTPDQVSETKWQVLHVTPADLYSQVRDIADIAKLKDFVNLIDSIEQPYSRAKIDAARQAYNKLSKFLITQIPDETTQKYKEIVGSITFDEQSLDKPDLSLFDKTDVKYDKRVCTKAKLEKALPELEKTLLEGILPYLGINGGLTNVVQTKLYTNAFVSEVYKTIVKLINSSNDLRSFLSGLVSPNVVARNLEISKDKDGNKFAGAVEKLRNTANNAQAIAALVFENGDMGFNDGDKEGFLDAVSALFRSLSQLAGVIQFENKIDKVNGTYTYGMYEELIPIFEMLDAEGYMSSHEYTLYVENEISEYSDGADKNQIGMEARIRPILVPIFNLIDSFAEKPLDTLLDLLPKLGYLLKSEILNTQISKILDSASLFGKPLGISVDLTASGLYDIIKGKNETLSIALDENNSITIDKNNFINFVNTVGGCANATVKKSVTRGHAYRMGLKSDKADTFVVTVNWLYNEITEGKNMTALENVLENSDTLNATVKSIVKMLLRIVSLGSANKIIHITGVIFASGYSRILIFILKIMTVIKHLR